MALPMVMMAAKAGALAKTAGPVLADWNQLGPAEKQRLQSQAGAVMADLNRLRRCLGARFFGESEEEMSWEEARDFATAPSADFLMATRLAELVRLETEVAEETLRKRVGAVGPDDAVFASALEIAEDDGYVERAGEDRWRVTDFGDQELVESDHVRYIEESVVAHLTEVGLAGRDQLALELGAPEFHSAEFQAGVERALVSGAVAWLGPGLYGVPPSQLSSYETPDDEDQEAQTGDPDELKGVLSDLKASIGNLRGAVAAARMANALSATGQTPVALGAAPMDSRPNGIQARAEALGALRELKELSDAGILTAEEFEAKKTQLLAQI